MLDILLLVVHSIAVVESSTYHIALPTMSPPTNPAITALLYVSDTSVEVTTPVSGCIVSKTGNKILLNDTCKGLFPEGVGLSQKGIKATSANPFTLHVYPATPSGEAYGDGYLAIPDEHLGTEYYVVTYCTTGGQCQFSVVGTVADTSVMIRFPVNIDTVSVCVNGQTVVSSGAATPFTLNENDVLHFESTNDLSGTHITSSENVALLVGTNGVPYHEGDVQIFEQLLPTRKWANEYVVIPNELNDAGDIIKIVTMTSNTKLESTGYSPVVVQQAGKFVEWRIDWHMNSKIKASNPVLIIQIMSVNLYNDSGNVGGPPAMVILQSPRQWSNSGGTMYCNDDNSNIDKALRFVAHYTAYLVLPVPLSSQTFSSEIQATNISVDVFDHSSSGTGDNITSTPNFTYGHSFYCKYNGTNSATAMLLSNNLDDNREECIPSLATPGDDVDNNCDGQIDEIKDCTEQNLEKRFNSSQKADGTSDLHSVEIGMPGKMKFHVKTCDVAEALLWCSDDIDSHVTLQISNSGMYLHESGGRTDNGDAMNPPPCVDEEVWLKWESGTPSSTITAGSTGLATAAQQVTVTTENSCFDMLTFHSLSGDSEFVVYAADDCDKIIEGEADNYGIQFIIPVAKDDSLFYIWVTANDAANLKFYPSGNTITSPYEESVTNNDTKQVLKTEISISDHYTYLLLKADAEVAVFIYRKKIASKPGFGLNLMPTDILGPAYHTADLNSTTNNECTIYSIDRELTSTDGTDVTFTIAEQANYTSTDSDFLETRQVMPVFCGDDTDSVLQMPPRETLGTKFFIPSIPFGGNIQDALITVVTTEDSTYIKILGDYDREDIIDEQWTRFHREFVTDERFTIQTNKPVLVYLVLRMTDSHVVSTVVPPVTQYKTATVFPKQGYFTVLQSYGIDIDGNTSIAVPNSSLSQSTTQRITHDKPFWLLVFLVQNQDRFIWSGDIFLLDQNELCVINDGKQSGQDDDCDGLTDEEICNLSVVAGETDIDIDGSVNEDCDPTDAGYNTYSSASNVFSLTIDHSIIECSAQGSPSTTSPEPDANDIPPTPIPEWGQPSATLNPPEIPPEVNPEYLPIDQMTNLTATVSIPAGNDTDSNKTEPVELCDCVCPCGWVNPPNLTEVELKEKVEKIQEKLKIKKTALSAWVRSKTSAKDNRPSATVVGTAGVTFLVITLTAVVMLDFASILRDLRLLLDNVKQAFQA